MNATLEVPVPLTKSRTVKPAKRKILLVNDDSAVRKILRQLLAEEGFLVLTAASGVEALELANITKCDLVLLDLKTQTEDEWETSERLSTQNPLLPVILITDGINRFFHALALGGALLERPLNFKKLLHMIHNLLKEAAEERLARFIGRPAGFHYTPPTEAPPKKSGG
jgi:DNA-binding response OmpR family regulator